MMQLVQAQLHFPWAQGLHQHLIVPQILPDPSIRALQRVRAALTRVSLSRLQPLPPFSPWQLGADEAKVPAISVFH